MGRFKTLNFDFGVVNSDTMKLFFYALNQKALCYGHF